MSSTVASAVVRLLLPAQPVTVKRPNETPNETTMMDLEQINDDLLYRKKNWISIVPSASSSIAAEGRGTNKQRFGRN
jgi:hypothetical protein